MHNNNLALEKQSIPNLDALPEKLSSSSHQMMRSYLDSFDNTQILGQRKEELSAILSIAHEAYKKIGKKFEEIELFEAGNNPKGSLNYSLAANNIHYFFLNHPILKYTGYDISFDKTCDHKEILLEGPKKKKMTRQISELVKTFVKTQAEDYSEFKDRISNSSNPIIFSTYVLGMPELEKKKFWELPGVHIHSLLVADLEARWLEKNYPREYEIISGEEQGRHVHKIEEFVNKEFRLKNRNGPAQDQIDKLCGEFFDIHSCKYHLLNNNNALIYYKL
ncbi:MAG TPA: hypothetical protein VEC16_02130 [Alphaproteobacteria bacterium]|nr:hypothetical protein [Alphaproteobacteria bacterium]